jgi:hypothetical protein
MSKYFDYSKLSEKDIEKLAANVKKDMDDKKAEEKRKGFKIVK